MKQKDFCKSCSFLAAVLAVSALSVFPAKAEEVVVLDLSDKSSDSPTLDYLKNSNQLIPQKGAWDSSTKTWGEASSIESPGSGYSLSKVDTDGRNVLKKYSYNKESGQLEPSYYQVNLDKNISVKLQTQATLDSLKEKNMNIPQKVYQRDEYGNIIKVDDKPVLKDTAPIKSPGSAYTLTQVNEKDENTITMYTLDADTNKLVPQYYRINLNKTTYGEGSEAKYYNWSTDYWGFHKLESVEMPTEGNADITVKYGSSEYDIAETRIEDISSTSNTTNKTFEGFSSQYGGAISNWSENSDVDINADFIRNSAGTLGGAICNANNATIGDITGNFVENTASEEGGAILLASGAKSSNIVGVFIHNSAGYGGAIANAGAIKDIKGDFIANVATYYGGAISNALGGVTVDNITGNFIGNSAYEGGAIFNSLESTTANITANFIGNSAMAYTGGAIDNSGRIGNMTGDFIENTAMTYGGAICNYNSGVIDNIVSDFVSNNAADGGAIANSGKIGDITGNFIGNSVNIPDYDGDRENNGGAIYNSGTIDSITGKFVGNMSDYRGGAIYNPGIIQKIAADFIGNETTYNGGAIYNTGKIDEITSDFIGNVAYADSEALGSSAFFGGAIYNSGTIGNIYGDFVGNSGVASSGAIYNNGSIENITGNFTANTASNGGAIYNNMNCTMGNITGDFLNNAAKTGGAMYNRGIVADIIGDFVGNTASGFNSYGGAIYNINTIGNLTGDFIGNKLSSTYLFTSSNGGAIYNTNSIGNITGNFISNTISSGSSFGGAISNYRGSIGTKDSQDNVIGGIINSNFYDNNATTSSAAKTAKGGAIYTSGNLNIIADNGSSTFKGNYVQIGQNEKDYQAIYVDSSASLNLITRNDGIINMHDNINGTNGYTVNITGDSTGTLNLYNDIKNANVNVDTVTVNLADNTMHNYEFEKLTSDANANYVIDIDFVNKTSDKITTSKDSNGIVTLDYLRVSNEFDITPNETYKIQILDTPIDALQLALSETVKSQLGDEDYKIGESVKEISDQINAFTNWKDEYSIYEQKTDIYGRLGLATTNTTNDSIGIVYSRSEQGDLVFKASQGDTLALWNNLNTEEVKNFNFDTSKDIYVVSKNNPETIALGETKGSELNVNGVIEDDTRSTIDLNHRKGFELKTATTLNIKNVNLINGNGENASVIEAIDSNSTINLTNVNLIKNTSNSDGAAIYSNSDVNISADNSITEITNNFSNDKNEAIYVANSEKTLTLNSINNGNLVINDSINGALGYTVNITGDNSGMLSLYNDINNANVQLGNTTLNTINDSVHIYNFDSFTLKGNSNMLADVDLAKEEMDRITAKNYGDHSSNILTVQGMSLLSDMNPDKNRLSILFAEEGLKNNVQGVLSLPDNYQTTAYTPIYKYNVSYDNRDDAGYFVFERGGLVSGNPSDNFNPAVLESPVASRAGAQSAISETVRFAFQHMDAFSQLPFSERMAIIHNNKYAINDTSVHQRFNDELHQGANKAYWVRPYTSFERINLNNGPDVDAIVYGTLVGFDSNFKALKRGWYNVQSVYAGYNGSTLTYPGVETTLNGGVVGLTETFYKNNLFTALTATGGASFASGSTMYGNEDYAMLLGGLGAKGGYNFEFKDGKYIVQPILFTNYSFVNTFDYTSASGVRMTSTPLHTLQINPQIKVVANLKNGWQPYARVGMVWSVLNTTKVKANDVIIPRMTVDPYVEYGVGIQRNWRERFTGFAQAMVRNGGRNGIAFTFGFRWVLGKESSDL